MHEVICLLYEYKDECRVTEYFNDLTGDYKHTSKISKYKTSYHLLFCFLAANATWGRLFKARLALTQG